MKNNTLTNHIPVHSTKIHTYSGTNNELVNEFLDINYLGFAEFTAALSKDVLYQSIADTGRKRYKLSKELYQTAISLKQASDNLLDLHYLYIRSSLPSYDNKPFMIENYSDSYSVLAKDVGSLRYKEGVEVLTGITDLIVNIAKKDILVEESLSKIVSMEDNFYKARTSLNNAWIISEPYMLPKSTVQK